MNTHQTWRKSSRSTSNAQCVELAVTDKETGVRDTKNRAAGSLSFNISTFGAFLANVKRGRHDLG